MKIKQVIAVATAAVFGCAITSAAQSQVQIDGAVVTVTVPTQAGSALTQPDQASPGIDFENAQPMPLPVASTPPPAGVSAEATPLSQLLGPSGGEPGNPGNGVKHAVQLVAPKDLSAATSIEPEDYGTGGIGVSQQPYTTARVNATNDYTAQDLPISSHRQAAPSRRLNHPLLFRFAYQTRYRGYSRTLRGKLWPEPILVRMDIRPGI